MRLGSTRFAWPGGELPGAQPRALALAGLMLLGALLTTLALAPPAGVQAPDGPYVQYDGGEMFTCGLKADGAIDCWGTNTVHVHQEDVYAGQATPPQGVTFTSLGVGRYHACGIRAADKHAQCWGSNWIWSMFPDMGTKTTGQATPGDDDYVSIGGGDYHTCGITTTGEAKCFGSDKDEDYNDWTNQSESQIGPFTHMSSGAYHNCAVRVSGGSVMCWGADDWGQSSHEKPGAFTQVAAGNNHRCGLRPDGSVECWGGNTWSQAPNLRAGPYTQIAAGDLFTCGLLVDGTLDCWGYNFYGQTKEPDGVWTTFGLGDAHGCASNTGTGAWQCWGRNNKGQAPRNPSYPPTAIGPEANPPVVQIIFDPPVPNGNDGWYLRAVRVDPQASDDSGIKDLRCIIDPPSIPASFADLPSEPCAFQDGRLVTTGGTHTFYAAAKDTWGNVSEVASVSFKVSYDWGGFYAPVENPPSLNQATAGQSVPLKFSLAGDQGLEVIAAGYPVSQEVSCETLAPVGQASPVKPAGRSALSYDPSSEWYGYVWKTEKGWGGTCRVMTLRLVDGTEHQAYFQFK